MKKLKRLVSKVSRKSKTLLKIIQVFLTQRGSLDYYLLRGRLLLKMNKNHNAFTTFDKGFHLYPNNVNINYHLAKLSMEKKDWKLAIKHWDIVMKSKGMKSSEDYLKFYEALTKAKKSERGEKVLNTALSNFPNDEEIALKLSDSLKDRKEWKQSADMLANLFMKAKNPSQVKTYINLSNAYLKLGFYDEAEDVLKTGAVEKPTNKKILNKLADLAVQKKDWNNAIQWYEKICELYEQKIPLNTLVRLSMINQIIGNIETANNVFQRALDEHEDKMKEDKEGFRKILLYNNGETQIEFYKKLERTNRVVVTFDSLYMVWKNPPFGYGILRKQQGLDIISVRKKRKKTYHQDLSRDDFISVVSKMIKGYDDKIAYGFSLGAYSAFYYTSSLDFRILALSPRLPIHPIYGEPKEIPKAEFKHELVQPYNERISPIIVYDPKQEIDSTYTQSQLIHSFPNANLVDVPYGGHGIARHLLRMGLLKDFVLTFINGKETPKYDRRLKSKSANYCWTLGRACFKRNKIKWAEELADRSLQLLPTGKHCIRLKIDILKRKNLFEEAINFAEKSIEYYPKNLEYRIALIDLCIQTNDIGKAEKQIDFASEVFNNPNRISERKNRIKDAKYNEE